MRGSLFAIILISACISTVRSQELEADNLTDGEGLRQGTWVLFYDSTFKTALPDTSGAMYYRRLQYRNDTIIGKVRDYFMDGILQWEGYMTSLDSTGMNGEFTQYYPLGNVKMKGFAKEGKQTGPFSYYFESGSLMIEGNMLNDSIHGPYNEFHPNGQVSAIGGMDMGKSVGPFKFYYDNGQLSAEGDYINNNKSGLWTYYYENGNLKEKTWHKDGLMHGGTEYYLEDGSLKYKGQYENGQDVGYWYWYFPDGTIEMEGYREGDDWHGDFKEYYDNGNLYSEGERLNGIREGIWKYYYPSGKLRSIDTFKEDVWNGERLYYSEEGILVQKGTLIGESREGDWEFYYDNGQLETRVKFKNDLGNGLTEYFWPNGRLKSRAEYINGKARGPYVSYFENGQLELKGEYGPDGKEGEWLQYFENGRLRNKGTYSKGEQHGHWWYYHDNGNLMSEGDFFEGASTGVWTYYNRDSTLHSKGAETDDIKEGIWEFYGWDNKLKSKGLAKNNKYEGLWTYYDSLGNITGQGVYKDGNFEGEWKYYHPNGELESIGIYRDDVKEGYWKYYDEEGKLLRKEKNEKGNLYDYAYVANKAMDAAEEGDRETTDKLVREARSLWRKEFKKDSPGYHFFDQLRGYVAKEFFEYDDAIKYFKQSSEQAKVTQGDSAKDYGYVLSFLADVYSTTKNYDVSAELYEKTLPIVERTRGKDNAWYISDLRGLAYSYYYTGKGDTAVQIMEQDIFERIQTRSDQSLLQRQLYDLGNVQYRAGLYEDAISSFNRAIALGDTTEMEDTFAYLESHRFIAYCLESMSMQDSALVYYWQTAEKHRDIGDSTSEGYIYTLKNIGEIYYTLSRDKEGFEVAEVIDRILSDSPYKGSEVYYEGKLLKAKMLVALYRYDDAKDFIESTIREHEAQDLIYTANLSETYQALGFVAKGLRKPWQEVEEYMKYSLSLLPDDTYSNTYANGYRALMQTYNDARQWQKSLSIARATLEYLDRYDSDNITYRADAYAGMGYVYFNLTDYDNALIYYDSAIRQYDKLLSRFYVPKAQTLADIADVYESAGEPRQGTKFLLESINLIREYKAENTKEYTDILVKMGDHYRSIGIWRNSFSFYREAKDKREALLGRYNTSYISVVGRLIHAHTQEGEYKQARELIEEMKEIAEQIDNSDYGTEVLSYEGKIYQKLGKYPEATERFIEYARRSEDVFGNSDRHAINLQDVTDYFLASGQPRRALDYAQRSLDIIIRTRGEGSIYHADYLATLTDIYLAMDNFAEALRNQEQVLQIILERMGSGTDKEVDERIKLARLYRFIGMYEEAETTWIQALEMSSNRHGYTWWYARELDYFSGLYISWKRPDQAIKVAQSGIALLDTLEFTEPYEYIGFYNTMGLAYSSSGNLDSAQYFLTKAREVSLETYGDKSRSFATYSHNLAFTYTRQGRYEEAEQLYLKAHGIITSRDDMGELEKVTLDNDMAALYTMWGKLDKAEEYWNSVTDKLLTKITNDFPRLSEKEKSTFWNAYNADFENYNTYAVMAAESNPSVVGKMYDHQIQTKSILLSTSSRERSRILNSGDSSLVSSYYRYIGIKEQLATYYSYSTERLAADGINLDSLESVANGLEASLSLDADGLAQENELLNIRWRDIQRKLTNEEAAIEIVRFRYFDLANSDSVLYAALILTSDTRRVPDLVVLPNGNELEGRYFTAYNSAIRFRVDDEYSFEQYWSRIDEKLAGRKTVYISPDGVYNQINVNTLRRPDGSYLIDDHNFIFLTSSRELVMLDRDTRREVRSGNAELFGFPSYSLSHTEIQDYVQERGLETTGSIERALDLERFGFSDLPGTKTETESITELLKDKQWEANLYLGNEALEEIVKSVQGPRVLHIATHGYFLDDVDAEADLMLGVSTSQSKKDPLLRSGLLLAGAAETVRGNTSGQTENGILTAYEAANLNLSGTELVVLSACETGRGEVKSGEGVYGLQRAFQVAGAESLIMSLWKVDDAATQSLMTAFYTNWLQGQSKKEAFRNAQNEVRAEWPHPYYWGAFVLIGE